MSQCIDCANRPSDNDSLGGAAHEGTATPLVIGIIAGTVLVFILVVCALFYCVKLENNKHTAKAGGDSPSSGEGGADGGASAKSRPSSVTVVPSEGGGAATMAAAGGESLGKKRLFGWRRRSGGEYARGRAGASHALRRLG